MFDLTGVYKRIGPAYFCLFLFCFQVTDFSVLWWVEDDFRMTFFSHALFRQVN